LISFFGGLALLLACVGLYGIVAQGVARRTNEIGVRMALGAQPGAIRAMVLRDTSILVLVGLAVGLPAAFGATRLISSELYGVGSADPLSFLVAIIMLAAVSALAGYLPRPARCPCGPHRPRSVTSSAVRPQISWNETVSGAYKRGEAPR